MLPQKVPEEKIIELEKHRRRVAAGYVSPRRALVMKAKRAQQREFLRHFSRTLSPRLSAKATGIELSKYQNWRGTDPVFCQMFNDTMQEALEELQGSVLVRAMGQHAMTEDGTPLYDSSGRPVYVGGSDRLAIALLGLNEARTESRDVVVNIDIVSRKSTNGEVIEDASFTEGY